MWISTLRFSLFYLLSPKIENLFLLRKYSDMNPWIAHVKMSAKKYNITYAQAIKDPRTKASYKK